MIPFFVGLTGGTVDSVEFGAFINYTKAAPICVHSYLLKSPGVELRDCEEAEQGMFAPRSAPRVLTFLRKRSGTSL